MATIIAKTAGGYLLEVNDNELARIAGYRGAHDTAWRAKLADIYATGRRCDLVEVKIPVEAHATFLRRLEEHRAKMKLDAKMLRELADMLEAVPAALNVIERLEAEQESILEGITNG